MTVATTRGALLRGTSTENEYGDEIEDNVTPVTGYGDFPLSLIERDALEFDPTSGEPRTVRVIIGRPTTGVLPVTAGDRIKDLRDGAVYSVESFKRTPRGLSGRASVTMKLKRTGP